MRKDVGASAGLLALLALFVHTELPHSEDGVPGKPSSGAETAAKTGDRIEMLEGPWLATQAFFHAASSSPPQDSHAEKSRKLLIGDLTSAGEMKALNPKLCDLLGLQRDVRSRPEMFSVVAAVADPSHTHMALSLDGETEAIERSVQARGWDFSEQWLPWVDRFDGNEPDINARRAQRRMQRDQEELPGILVFRAQGEENGFPNFPRRVLFVFLVPETVTGGINGPAFYAAMHLANVLSSKKPDGSYNQIGLLAPSFSGGFESLSRLLNVVKGWGPARISSPVYGGMVANLNYARAFVRDSGLSFHGGILDSDDYQVALCAVLAKYHDHVGETAALLKEDEGGLQQSIGPTCKLQTYTFPREISHLRNAYQDASGDEARNPYADQPGRVNFSIRDPNSGEDSIPTFSETQTPLTQDSILSSITDELNRQHTHLVFISVTNPLDALFLLRAVRAACPNARVVIEGPSVLFVAAAAREALDGTLFLSPYPMFFEGDDWLECTPADSDKTKGTCKDSRLPDRLMFAQQEFQGLYNVTQLLLTDMRAESRPESLRGYSQPGQPYPGVWLLTLNRFGFLPVDLVGPADLRRESWSSVPEKEVDVALGKRKASAEFGGLYATEGWPSIPPERLLRALLLPAFYTVRRERLPVVEDWFKPNPEAKATALPSALDPGTAPRPWMLTVLAVSVAILLACFTFVRCNISRWEAKPIWLVFSDRYTSRLEALLCACLSLSALEWILALPWCIPRGTFFQSDGWRVELLRLSILFGLAAPLLTLLFTLYLLRKRGVISQSSITKATLRNILYYATPMALFGLLVWGWFYLCSLPDTGLFFRFRALELYSGSSPALPLALACLVFFCISLFHLKQYALAGLAHPRLKIEPGVPPAAYRVRFKSTYDTIERRIAAPWTLEFRVLAYRTVAALVFVGFCFMILWESTSAFELWPYNVLLGFAIMAILFCLATKWYDLWTLWGSVNKLLNLIQVLPLRPAIQRIAEDWPRRPIWAFDRSVSKEAVGREMVYALHRRAVILKNIEAGLPKAKMAAAGAAEAGGASQESVIHRGEADSGTNGDGQIRSVAGERPTTSAEANDHLDKFRKPLFGASPDSPQPEVRSILGVRQLALYFWNILKGNTKPAAFAKLAAIANHETLCADLAGEIYDRDLRPAWRASLNEETDIAPNGDKSESPHRKYVDYCADFVALQFCHFIAYAVAQVKRMATCLSLSFVLLIVLFNSYSPEGPQLIARWLGVLFLVIGFAVWRVFSQMERNPILSAIAHTTPGELSGEFWLNLLVLGGLPLLGVLGRLFPSVSQFLFQWIAPSVQAVH